MTNAYFDDVYWMRADARIFFLLSSDRLWIMILIRDILDEVEIIDG